MKRFVAAAMWSMVALAAAPAPAVAQYPTRPIQLLVPFPAGGVVDAIARRFAEALAPVAKQAVVVQNRDGASGIIAMDALAKSPPDGYTLAFAPNGPLTIQPSLRKTPFALTSFTPLCQVSIVTYVLVVPPTSPITNLKEFLARAKSAGEAKAAIGGVGTLPHFALLQLASAGNAKLLIVPYRGDPGVTLAVKGGDVEAGVLGVDTAMAQGFRILAVFAAQRLPFLPDAPTAREQGVDVVATSNTGLFAPAGLDKGAAASLESWCAEVAKDPQFTRAVANFKQETAYLPGPKFAEVLAADAEEKRKLIEVTGIKQEQ